ncbi:MAG: LysR family transcriptional regulator, partial [Proteobacteria bacterium]
MDRLEAMTMLVKVSEAGSFSAAARALRIPLTTLSRRIADLETHVGARLLHRTTRKLTVTDAGASYLTAARRILEQVEAAEREAAGEATLPKGQLVITAPIHFGRLHVVPVVAAFLADHPEIDVRLVLTDRNLDLIDDHVDLAVRIGSLPDSSLTATRVGSTRTVTCASPALLSRYGVPREPRDLAERPCIVVETSLPVSSWRFGRPKGGAPLDVSIVPRLLVSTTEAAAQAAILGVGLTRLLRYQVADAVADRSLRIVLEAYEPEPSPIHLLHAARGS